MCGCLYTKRFVIINAKLINCTVQKLMKSLMEYFMFYAVLLQQTFSELHNLIKPIPEIPQKDLSVIIYNCLCILRFLNKI